MTARLSAAVVVVHMIVGAGLIVSIRMVVWLILLFLSAVVLLSAVCRGSIFIGLVGVGWLLPAGTAQVEWIVALWLIAPERIAALTVVLLQTIFARGIVSHPILAWVVWDGGVCRGWSAVSDTIHLGRR